MSNYQKVMAFINNHVLDTGYAVRYQAALVALEEMRRDVEQFDWLLAHQPWRSVVTRERLDVWMKLEGGDAPCPTNVNHSPGCNDAPAAQQDAAGASVSYECAKGEGDDNAVVDVGNSGIHGPVDDISVVIDRVELGPQSQMAMAAVVHPPECAVRMAAGASDEYAYETATDAEHAVGIAAAKQLVPSVNAPECAVRKALEDSWEWFHGVDAREEFQLAQQRDVALATSCPCQPVVHEGSAAYALTMTAERDEALRQLVNRDAQKLMLRVNLDALASAIMPHRQFHGTGDYPIPELVKAVEELRVENERLKADKLHEHSDMMREMLFTFWEGHPEVEIVQLRADLAAEKAAREVLIEDNARLRKDMDALNSAREKAEAALAEAVDIIQGYMDGPQSWGELNRRLDRAATFVAAHRESKDAA
jgi:hypothetical protein